MYRRTKILATLGPATDSDKVLDDIIEAGVDVVRINFSHGNHEEHQRRAEWIRNRARAYGRQVGVLADLQGPKIRIEKFADGPVELYDDETFILDTSLGEREGTRERVGVTYKDLPKDVKRGDTLLLDDGRIALWVNDVDVQAGIIETRVQVGGELSDSKGLNRKGGGLSAGALTEKDCEDIKQVAALDADYMAVSFVRSANDIKEARHLLKEAGGNPNTGIVAKIERREALDDLDSIILASDVVMIARGDLGVEIGDAELPGVQKHIIQRARSLNRVVIVATQMMESMIINSMPTRAEVMDVANAVLDGTDSVMLSGETAVGRYPALVVGAVDRICAGAEKQRAARISTHRMEEEFSRVDEAIAMAAMYTANHTDVKAIACLTESGSTPLWMSRISSGIPIFALTRHAKTRRRVTLYRGVYPVSFEVPDKIANLDLNREITDELVRRGAVRNGDTVLLTRGDAMGVMGGTNSLKIITVGDG